MCPQCSEPHPYTSTGQFAQIIPGLPALVAIHMPLGANTLSVALLNANGQALSVALVLGQKVSTPVGFEPTRGDPIGLAGRRLNHSAKVSSDLGHILLPDIFAGRPSMPWLSKAPALTVHCGSVVPTSLFRSVSALVLFLACNLGGSVCWIRPDSVLFHMVVVRSVAECLHLILSA